MNTETTHPDAATVAEEFPDFPVAAIPADLPDWLVCEAWHNDACPLWSGAPSLTAANGQRLRLAIDYPDPAMREVGGGHLFCVYTMDDAGGDAPTLYHGDDWQAAMVPLLAWRFASELRGWLTMPEMATVNERNAADPRGCASHDFCDANMAMDAAWNVTMDRPFLPDDDASEPTDADMDLLNAAWSMARERRFWAPSLRRYRPTLRPVSYGALPRGVAWDYVEAPAMAGLANRPDLPQSRHRYGVICTDRVLTAEECKRYDLVGV